MCVSSRWVTYGTYLRAMYKSHFTVTTIFVFHRCTDSKQKYLQVASFTVNNHHHHHHFWQAPLRVRSAERRHQSPEWTVLSQVNCVVHIYLLILKHT